jgi:hypothetical protein
MLVTVSPKAGYGGGGSLDVDDLDAGGWTSYLRMVYRQVSTSGPHSSTSYVQLLAPCPLVLCLCML